MEALAQDYVVVKRSPADPRVIVAGGGLVRLPSASLLATVPLLPRYDSTAASEVHLMRSDDQGRSWQPAGPPLPWYTAAPWVHDGSLYLFAHKKGTTHRNDDVLLLRSDDEGATWAGPVTLFEGHYWNCPTGIVEANGQVYRALDQLDVPGRGHVVIAGDLSRDLLDPAAWRISRPTPYPGTPDALVRGLYPPRRHPTVRGDLWLEPNVVCVNGALRVQSRVEIDGYATAGLCAVCDLADDGATLDLRFVQFHPMPGGQNKFHIIHHARSGLFWTAVNLVTDPQNSQGWDERLWRQGFLGGPGNERRFLMLLYSLDALNWWQAGCVARWASPLQGFQYASLLVDGEDLLLLVRTSENGPNQHDADLMTLHRVPDFRTLALDLRTPE